LPGRGYLFPGQVASVCEKRFCPIVHMTDLPIIVSDEMPGNFSSVQYMVTGESGLMLQSTP
jgi:hypothetical protein